jgi:hypothetical protein
MFSIRSLFTVSLAASALTLVACSGGSPGTPSPAGTNNTGMTEFSVSLMDAPVDDVAEVNVEIRAIWLKPEEGPAFSLPLVESPITVDLLALTDENAALLVDGTLIEPGSYEWLAMDVNATIDNVFDSYVVTHAGTWIEVRVPSGRVRLVDGFEAEANEAMALIFDWDVRRGLVHPPGLGGRDVVAYILKPAFRVIDTAVFGRVRGTIAMDSVLDEANVCDADDENYDVGNSVYIFAGHGIEPDDIDMEDDVAPIATVDAVLSEDETAYEYSTILPFGDYTVAFTCQAANDGAETNETGNADPEDDSVAFFAPAVDVTLSAIVGETGAEVDFPASE